MAALAAIALFGCTSTAPAPDPTVSAFTVDSSQEVAAQTTLTTFLESARQGDRPSYDRTLSSRDASFASRSRELFDNLQALPLTELRAELEPGPQRLPESRRAIFGADAWMQPARLYWRLPGDSAVAEHTVWLTFVAEGGQVQIAGTVDEPNPHPVRQQPSWWLGSVRSSQLGQVTVLVGAGQTSATWLAVGQRALTQVGRHLPVEAAPTDRRSLVLEVPATTADFESVVGAEPGSYADIAAVTTAEGAGPDAALRVVLNPDAVRRLTPEGLAITVTHESVHVVTRSPQSPAPLWVVEGLADYVALRAYPDAAAGVAGPLLDDVAAHGPPRTLPPDSAFAAGAADLGLAYAQGWTACRFIADDTSATRLGRLYRALDRGATLDEATDDELGRSVTDLTDGWRRSLAAEAKRR
ncbi:MAG TPA: hypothetical protein VIT20_01085 [Propionibacteriaceae bacterium]